MIREELLSRSKRLRSIPRYQQRHLHQSGWLLNWAVANTGKPFKLNHPLPPPSGYSPTLRVREKVTSMPCQHRQQQQCHDVGDLDHGVYGGAGGVFVGVAYGVARH